MFFLPNLNVGGAEKIFLNIINKISERGYNVTLCLLIAEGPLLDKVSPRVKVVNLSKRRAVFSIYSMLRVIYKYKPNVIFSTHWHLNIILSMISILVSSKIKFVIREINTLSNIDFFEGRFKRKILTFAYSRFSCIVCQSNDMKDDLISKFGIRKNCIKVVHNAVDLDRYQNIVKKKYCENNKEITIVTVGRLTHQKGYDILIRSLSNIREFDFKLFIVGSGEEYNYLNELILENNLQDKIKLVGFKNDPIKYLLISDLFISSSRYEGFPNAVLEALACGLPVVSNNYPGGINEIIRSGFNGQIIDISNKKHLESVIQEVVSYSSDNIRSDVFKRFDLEHMINQYISLL